jgi:hypothetical protein
LDGRLGEPQGWSEGCEEEKNLLPLPGTEPQSLGCPTLSLIIPTEAIEIFKASLKRPAINK